MTQEIHQEPFIHLVDLSHDRALIAWGAFYFVRQSVDQSWVIVDDEQLPELTGRHTCIGTSAEPFGDAVVEVLDASGDVVSRAETSEQCWLWLDGLTPDTAYTYRVLVDGEAWASGYRWDWTAAARGGYDLQRGGRQYDLSFQTWPDPDAPSPPLSFVALGDYGVGIRSDSESSCRQRRIAEVLDLLVSDRDIRFVLSLGDNIYQGELGAVDDESGGEDDDWYSSFFAPYRYALAKVPFFPTIGNHDTSDTEGSDDRAQMEDNFHIAQRFRDESGRSSVDPGLFYRLRFGRDIEFVCLDTSQDEENEDVHRYFQDPVHRAWLDDVFSAADVRWRIPFSHHPCYCAGPSHENDKEMIRDLVPLFDQGGVRLALAGHEHNFQVNEVGGRMYVVSGAGGKVREEVPEQVHEAGTQAWTGQSHLLLAEVDAEQIALTPMSGLLNSGQPHLMTALGPDNAIVYPPFVVRAGDSGIATS